MKRAASFLVALLAFAGAASAQSLLEGQDASPYDPPQKPEIRLHDPVRVEFSAKEGTPADTIGAEVADIRPNGTLVLRAIRSREADGEEKVTRLTGEVAPGAIQNGTVQADRVMNLHVSEEEPRKPGWLAWLLGKIWPF
jgi:DNA-directed RNA polymerase subunit H (RpoH/RPB5)